MGALNILYSKDLRPLYAFDSTTKRFCPSTPQEPSLYGDLYNYAVFYSTNQSYEMTKIQFAIRNSALEVEPDITTQGLYITIYNESMWIPSNIITVTGNRIISGKPKNYTCNIWAMLTILNDKILILLILFDFALSILSYISESNFRKTVEHSINCPSISMLDVAKKPDLNFWKHVGLFTHIALLKSSPFIPKSTVSRFLAGLFLLCVFVVSQFLSSFLMSEIAFLGLPKRIENLRDILENPDTRPIFSSFSEKLFLLSGTLEATAIRKQAIHHKSILNHPYIFQTLDTDVANGKSVIVYEYYLSLLALSKSQKKNFYISKDFCTSSPASLAFRKTLDYNVKEIINKRILVFQEGGFQNYFKSLLKRLSGIYFDSEIMVAEPLTMIHVVPSFVLVLCGNLVALTTLISELIIFRIKYGPMIDKVAS